MPRGRRGGRDVLGARSSRVAIAGVALAVLAVLVAVRTCGPGPRSGAPGEAVRARTTDTKPPPARRRAAATERPEESAPPPFVPVVVRVALPEGVRGTVEAFLLPARLVAGDDEAESFRPSSLEANPAVSVSAQGAATTVSVPAAGPVLVVARAPGWAPAWQIVVASTAQRARADVELAPVAGVVLRGVVLDEESRLAPGVEVVASGTGTGTETDPFPCDALCTRSRTDTNGRFELRDLAPGDHRLWLRRRGGAFRRMEDVRVPPVTDVELRLVRGAHVTGRVVEDATGEPLAGARVSLAEEDDWPRVGSLVYAAARCDERGRFELWSGVPECSRARIVVDAPGHARFPANDVFPRETPDLRDETEIEVLVRVARAATVVGTVRGTRGPVAGLHVHLEPKSEEYEDAWAGLWATTTEAAGAYRLDGVPPGAFELTVRHEFPDEVGGEATLEGDARPGDIVLLDVSLRRGDPARGRVLDPTGAPVEGALVTWSCGRMPGTTSTTADGRFELALPDQAELEVELAVRHPAWLATSAQVWEEEPEVGDIQLEPPLHVRGRVLDADGTPLAGARVTLVAGEPAQETFLYHLDSVASCRTDDDGTYDLALTDDGFAVVMACHPRDGRSVSLILDASSAAEFDLTFPSGVRLAGRVVEAADGRPIEGVSVRSGPWTGTLVARTDARGRFTYLEDGQAPAAFAFQREGYIETEVALKDVAVDARADVEVRMVRAFTVSGRVVDAEGRPRAGADVSLSRDDGEVVDSARSDAAGRFVFRDVAAGRVTLLVSDDDGTARAETTVDAGARDVTLLVK